MLRILCNRLVGLQRQGRRFCTKIEDKSLIAAATMLSYPDGRPYSFSHSTTARVVVTTSTLDAKVEEEDSKEKKKTSTEEEIQYIF